MFKGNHLTLCNTFAARSATLTWVAFCADPGGAGREDRPGATALGSVITGAR